MNLEVTRRLPGNETLFLSTKVSSLSTGFQYQLIHPEGIFSVTIFTSLRSVVLLAGQITLFLFFLNLYGIQFLFFCVMLRLQLLIKNRAVLCFVFLTFVASLLILSIKVKV